MKILDGQVTKHFNLSEFKCRGNGSLLLNAAVVEHIQRLEKFRVWYNRVMHVNSGYRSPGYNREIGGAPQSQHMLGLATDFMLPDEFYSFSKQRKTEFLLNVKYRWYELCDLDGINGGVGFYDTFIHLDSRTNKTRSFWDFRKE